ncbi:MAG: polymorphic toxin-type HINT domain-containing protein [Planctomycetales bacterium]|nr:polymorphic toxin-type HINT domain-containing protein [Planctomycetales bacterium]
MKQTDFRNTRILPVGDIRRAGAIVFEITDTRRCAFGEDAIISRSLAIFAALMLTFGGVFTVRDYARTQPQPLVASVDAPDRISSQQPQYLSKDIRDLQVMQDRVLADNPLEDETELPLGEIVPAEWRVVVLEHTDPNGTRHIIERGMPLDEIEADFNVAIASPQDGAIEAELDPSATTELNDPRASLSDAPVDLTGASSTVGDGLVVLTGHQTEPIAADPANRACRAGHSNYVRAASERIFIERRGLSRITTQPLAIGSTIFVDLPEHGISADFTVREIRPCPTPSADDGYLVTTKFIHENAEILDLRIQGSDNSIGTTASHPFWSEDRQQFVAAGDLRVGENLQLADDTTRRVESITLRPNRETVYNIEVDGEHVFYVGEGGVLVHNECRRRYITYRGIDPTNGKIYVGRSSGPVWMSAKQILSRRLSGHHRGTLKNAVVDMEAVGKKSARYAIRGREQMLMDNLSAAGRLTDQIRGISISNPRIKKYLNAAKSLFGLL